MGSHFNSGLRRPPLPLKTMNNSLIMMVTLLICIFIEYSVLGHFRYFFSQFPLSNRDGYRHFNILKIVTGFNGFHLFPRYLSIFLFLILSSMSFVCGVRYLPVLCSVSSPDYLSLLTSLGRY